MVFSLLILHIILILDLSSWVLGKPAWIKDMRLKSISSVSHSATYPPIIHRIELHVCQSLIKFDLPLAGDFLLTPMLSEMI